MPFRLCYKAFYSLYHNALMLKSKNCPAMMGLTGVTIMAVESGMVEAFLNILL